MRYPSSHANRLPVLELFPCIPSDRSFLDERLAMFGRTDLSTLSPTRHGPTPSSALVGCPIGIVIHHPGCIRTGRGLPLPIVESPSIEAFASLPWRRLALTAQGTISVWLMFLVVVSITSSDAIAHLEELKHSFQTSQSSAGERSVCL
ncbi:hypothetical protein BAUCODRAFT_124294 [Baudoinia panamericana UAMH 10762]|uniref:Uncharacterized protein n=1 Tax=Baudoinia panamericana (strain UAMH 10762) TaxID=717646 RepID=M2MT42_BAUPA|nr:uncharacterized protein BAUCODRAFT_124294 [Baudoinia panamericana UAMH 10762]EMC94693.1 hypothetical protein BAUCODRAFT_124294 [Baudoinia panamericana UAMH 10762]